MNAILCSLALLLALAAHADARKIPQIDGKIVYCYWRTWEDIPVEHIASSKICTHYAFAFMGIYGDAGSNDANARIFSQTIRRLHPGAKIMVSVGGRDDESLLRAVAASPENRRAFIDSVTAFLTEYDYDGVDIDWEYQSASDNHNFIIWMKEIRAELDKTGRQLTCAIGANNSGFLSQAHNVTELVEAAHFINLMTFDFHSSLEATTGHHAPMRDDTSKNVRDTVALWRLQGAPAKKLVLGIPFYGRNFWLRDRNNNGIGAPATGPGTAGMYPSFLPYKDICLDKNWNVRWDSAQQATYAVKDDQWVGFDNEQSMAVKGKFIEDEGLAGAVVWAVDNDDVYGRCDSGKLPLLNALNASF